MKPIRTLPIFYLWLLSLAMIMGLESVAWARNASEQGDRIQQEIPLRDALDKALAHVSNPRGSQPLSLNEHGVCVIHVPMLPELIRLRNNRLVVRVEMSPTGESFTLVTPLAPVRRGGSRAFFQTLLRRNRWADHTDGLTLALEQEDRNLDALVALYHWNRKVLTPQDFVELFKSYTAAVFSLIEDINALAAEEKAVTPLHQGRP